MRKMLNNTLYNHPPGGREERGVEGGGGGEELNKSQKSFKILLLKSYI